MQTGADAHEASPGIATDPRAARADGVRSPVGPSLLMHTSALLLSALLIRPSASRPAAVSQSPSAACQVWHECRQLALDAFERQEYETFHDLAWRAVQTGPKKDAALMYLLARAQSLSGRPHDALVMIQRLAEMGVPSDAATNDDFRRMRALAGWPDVEALIERVRTADATSRPALTAAAPPTATSTPAPTAAVSTAGSVAKAVPSGAAAVFEPVPVEQAVRISTPRFSTGGLAYDAVSGRFVVGDLHGRKLIVVEDGADHAVDLVRAESAGFHEIRAIEIDSRRGDLWVATATTDDTEWSLHQLQLVSGRPLRVLPLDAALGPTRLVDLAVSPAGTLLAVDAAGKRLLELRPRGTSLQPVPLAVEKPTSLAATSDDGVVYVAGAGGVARVDLRSGMTVPVSIPSGLELGGIERVRWHRNALLAVVVDARGSRSLVRFDLNASGRAATAATVIDQTMAATAGPVFTTLSGDQLSYVVADPAPPSDSGDAPPDRPAEFIIRRIRLH